MVVIVALKGALHYQEDLIGGQGGCRAHYLIENEFTVRRVCRFATYPYLPSETMAMSLTLPLQTQQAAVLICGFHATSKTTNPWWPVEALADSVHGASP